jgi:dienelactone hydrolase
VRIRAACFLLLVSATVSAQEMRFLYPLPDANAFTKTLIVYSTTSKELKADIYRPANVAAALPVAIFLNGIGADWIRTHSQYSGWATLVTTAGLAGIAMDADASAPEKSFDTLIEYLRAHAAELKVDPSNVVVYSCSSNVQAGLPLVSSASRPYIRSAVVYYGAGEVTDFRFDLPVLVARAGLDSANNNHAIDDLLARALKANAPWTLLNVHGGQHGFELVNADEESMAAVRQTIRFIQETVRPEMQKAISQAGGPAAAAGAVYAGNWQDAVRRYTALADANPSDSYFHQKLGEALLRTGESRRGIAELRRALENGTPNTGIISYMAAVASMQIGDQEGALGFLERLKDIPPMRERIKNDAVFAPLRSHPRFKAVVGS